MASETHSSKASFLFDLDGTLVDSIRGIGSALAGAFQSIGHTMPQTSLRAAIGPPIRIIAKRLQPELSDAETAAIEVAYRALYDESAWRETDLFPGVLDTLHTLNKQGHQLFVATNKPRIPTMKILARLGLGELLEDVVTRDSTEPKYAGKHEMLAALVERNHLSPESCVMVGDTAEDEHAAGATGMRFAFVTFGYGEAKAADYRLDEFTGLLAIAGMSEVPAAALSGAGGGR